MNKNEALKMAIEALPELISTAQCEFDSQHKAYEGYPAMYHRYGYLKDIADDGTNALEACKEALEQPTIAQLNDEYLNDTHVEGVSQPAQSYLSVINDKKLAKNNENVTERECVFCKQREVNFDD